MDEETSHEETQVSAGAFSSVGSAPDRAKKDQPSERAMAIADTLDKIGKGSSTFIKKIGEGSGQLAKKISKKSNEMKEKIQNSSSDGDNASVAGPGTFSLMASGHACARCGYINGNDDLFCANCGMPLVSASVTDTPHTTNEYLEKKTVCPTCGAENASGDSFCYRCGTNLNEADVEKTSTIHCPMCGVENGSEDAFCYKCGAHLS